MPVLYFFGSGWWGVRHLPTIPSLCWFLCFIWQSLISWVRKAYFWGSVIFVSFLWSWARFILQIWSHGFFVCEAVRSSCRFQCEIFLVLPTGPLQFATLFQWSLFHTPNFLSIVFYPLCQDSTNHSFSWAPSIVKSDKHAVSSRFNPSSAHFSSTFLSSL